MAKGVEDTSFYCFNRLISLNEVGGNPGEFGTSPEAFHAFCLRIQSQWPQTLLASATHDTKRGEDVRLRIGLLSEIPERWVEAVRRWSRMNRRFRRNGFPDPNTEYFLYQTLAGAWPIGCDRLVPFMRKSAKEAKIHTSWTDPDPNYEEALRGFVEGVLGHAEFTADLAAFLEPLAWPALVTSLSQTLIKCTAPGVPDIYQGTEFWDRNLVDPDNRRPVDFALLAATAERAAETDVRALVDEWRSGAIKMHVMRAGLDLRARMPELFAGGRYQPLRAEGPYAKHVVAFARTDGHRAAIAIAPRLPLRLLGNASAPLIPAPQWLDTQITLPPDLAARRWRNLLDPSAQIAGATPSLRALLQRFPVALLEAVDSPLAMETSAK
jgi:(1->4)-alpha-D-glucan 1-alpha-D-glucosylmutase